MPSPIVSVDSVLPMSKSDLESLPDQMREMFLGYVKPLNRAIEVFLESPQTTEEEFEQNFQNVKREYMRYYTTIVSDIQQNELEILLQKSFSSLPVSEPTPEVGLVDAQVQARPAEAEPLIPIEQTMNDAVKITATVTRLMLEPACQDHLLKHPAAWAPYRNLGAYTTILNYIFQAGTGGIEPSMVEKVIQRCQETVHEVKDFVDKLNIDLDPELTTALERFAYSGEKMA